MTRKAVVKRNTKETQISMDLSIDGSGKARIETGIGFLTICWTDLRGMDF